MITTHRGLLICFAAVALSSPAPAGAAQIPDPVGDTVDTVTETVDTVTGTVDGTVDSVTGAIETVEDTTEGVVDPIEDVTDTVDDTIDTVTDTVDDTTEEVTDTVDDTTETVEEVIGPQPEGSESSAGEGRAPAAQAPGTPDGGVGTPDSEPGNRIFGPTGPHDGGVTRTSGARALPGQRRTGNGQANSRMSPSSGDQTAKAAVGRPTFGADEAGTATGPSRHGSSILGRIAEAAKHAAFPLALALLVMGYIALQNRLDRRDPKLAAAAIDTEQELMHFE